MRRLDLGRPAKENDWNWVVNSLRKIEEASRDPSAERIADDFTITGELTETLTLDVDTATDEEIRHFLGTFITALKKRGIRRA